MIELTTIRELLEEVFNYTGDSLGTIEYRLEGLSLDEEWDNGHGASEPDFKFVAWSEKYVYFPLCYDGLFWIGSAPRNPGGSPLLPQGY